MAVKRALIERSFTLIMTLVMVSFCFMLIGTFFSISTSRLKILKARGGSYNVDLIRDSVVDLVTQEMRRSLSKKDKKTMNPSFSGASRSFWLPQKRNYFYLTSPDNSGLKNGIILSSGRPGNNFDLPAFRSISDSIQSKKSGVNSVSFWEKPLLGSVAESSLPDWIYLQSDGQPVSDSEDLKSGERPSYRFAFILHDTGGLLDANIAGRATSESTLRADGNPSVAFADLSQLPGFSQKMQDTLIQFRRGKAIDRTFSADERQRFFTNHWENTGLIANTQGENAFTTRQDLIQFYKSQGWSPETLKYLTTFSRSVERPLFRYDSSWTTSTENPSWTNLVVQSDYLRLDGTGAKKGTPLLERYFPLSWINKMSSDTSDDAFVQRAFGLTSSNGKWIYTAGTGSAVNSIASPTEIMALNRDPNFFELLKIGITSGSLGGSSSSASVSNTRVRTLDLISDYQIIRIGANIIDQYDADHEPMVIQFRGAEFYGVEDLPYINALVQRNHAQGGVVNAISIPYYLNIIPELWNIHRPLKGISSTAPYPSVRIRAQPGSKVYKEWRIFNVPLNTGGGQTIYPFPTMESFSSTPITVNGQSLETYREPRFIRGVDKGLSLIEAATPVNLVGQSVNGYSFAFDHSAAATPTVANFNGAYFVCTNAVLYAEYQNSKGNWLPYHAFSGLVAPSSVNVGSTETTGIVTPKIQVYANSLGTLPVTSFRDERYFLSRFSKADPRTTRYGFEQVYSIAAAHYEEFTLRPAVAMDTALRFVYTLNSGISTGSDGYYLPSLAENRYTTIPSIPLRGIRIPYNDADYKVRWGDYGLDDDPAIRSQTINPYKSNDDTYRPMMLDRPFRSVGELGYVHRDQPMKSLNFFTTNSGDYVLLDLFSAHDHPSVVAGKVAWNVPYPEIWKTLISGATRAYGATDFRTISSSEADNIASKIYNSYAGSNSFPVSRSDFIRGMADTEISSAWPAFKHHREAVVRQVAEVGQSQTLNLMLDLVIEEGKTVGDAAEKYQFNSSGSRRYWISFAMDRLTYEIIDARIEEVW